MKVGWQPHALDEFLASVPFPTPMQETHSFVLESMYDYELGHEQELLPISYTKLFRHQQALLLVLLTSPVPFLPACFRPRQLIQRLPSSDKQNPKGHIQAGTVLVGVHIKPVGQLQVFDVLLAVPVELPIFAQGIHDLLAAKTNDSGSGHQQVLVSVLKIKLFKHQQTLKSVLLTNPVPFLFFKRAQLKQVKFYKKIELAGQKQCNKDAFGFQIKPSKQAHTLVVLFMTPEELLTLLQEMHPRALSTYELESGHQQAPEVVLKTKVGRHAQIVGLVELINPVPFLVFTKEQQQQLLLPLKKTELTGHMQAGIVILGAQI